MKLVHVVWVDAAVSNTWRSQETAAKDLPHECRSVGYVLKNDDQCIVIAPHVSGEECNGDIVIPRVWVKSIVELVTKASPEYEETKREAKALWREFDKAVPGVVVNPEALADE